MRARKIVFLVIGLALSVAACAEAPTPVAQQFAVSGGIARVDSRLGGDRTAWIQLRTAERHSLSTEHQWVAADVVEYRLALAESSDGTTFTPVAPAVNLVLPAKGPVIPTGAQLTGLAAGKVYRVTLEAWGNAGGQPAGAHVLMNTQTRCYSDFDFRPNADHNVETSYTSTMHVIFDPLVISGAVTVTVASPSDAAIVCSPGATDPACPSPSPSPSPSPEPSPSPSAEGP